MRALYIDPFSGISGNMFIGAMIDAGLSPKGFLGGLAPLGIEEEDLIVEKREKTGILATYFNLKSEEVRGECRHHHHHRGLADMLELIEKSGFDREVKDLAKAIYLPMAEAEAAVHGKDLYEVHFHEVGELDAVVDVLGAAYYTVLSGVEAVYVGKINTGAGMVTCAHGTYPVPAPATAHILSTMEVPLGGAYVERELTTPTGAAILKGLRAQYRTRPEGRVLKVAYGAGSKDGVLANVLRIFLLETEEACVPVFYSCNLDDMTGEAMGFCMERLFDAGARDVSFAPIFMKKNRPGYRLDVLTDGGREKDVLDALFTHTTTLGVKKIPLEKIELPRAIRDVSTEFGPVATKFARYKDLEKIAPEYEDVKALAVKHGISMEAVRRAWELRS
ncbi:MAG: nickel pincer cofactor biosynthesis protein LarC [Peptoniphilus sp.]|nr:nickel pincer cofactor biosynthesis protein LarC [Peptoniphilus sp.]MDY3118168.1 nickel pincer cofactor biosynthesis protein LarC [Peptoniphilus sp.]